MAEAKREIRTPVKAIRANCLDCCNGSSTEVALCPVDYCPLYPYRLGKNPNRANYEMSDEQRAAASERMKKMNSSKSAPMP